jgi:hypothetical protein
LRRVLPLLLLVALSAACSVLSKPSTRFKLGELPPGWQPVRLADNDVAYSYGDSGHAVAVNAICEDHGDASLEVLTRHLLQGFTERQLLSQETVWLDGREALRSQYLARLEGVPVQLMLVVLKKDYCVYDFSYVAPPGRLEEHLPAFQSLVEGFHVERTS